jgi:hypothetical protein
MPFFREGKSELVRELMDECREFFGRCLSRRQGNFALQIDRKTVLGSWITFQSAETLERAMIYLGATEEQIAAHRSALGERGRA